MGEALQHGAAELGVESGLIAIGDGALVSWIRRLISEDTAALAGDLAERRTYHVTTLRGLPDGTSELTTYLVPGQYLDPWLSGLIRDGEGTVLSIEVV